MAAMNQNQATSASALLQVSERQLYRLMCRFRDGGLMTSSRASSSAALVTATGLSLIVRVNIGVPWCKQGLLIKSRDWLSVSRIMKDLSAD
jgi:hypothetical protein